MAHTAFHAALRAPGSVVGCGGQEKPPGEGGESCAQRPCQGKRHLFPLIGLNGCSNLASIDGEVAFCRAGQSLGPRVPPLCRTPGPPW